MSHSLIKANLNLHAVLPNLEALVEQDPEIQELVSSRDLSMQFAVWNGPKVRLVFRHGRCRVVPEFRLNSSVILLFATPGHLNAVMENRGSPVPINRNPLILPFLIRDFPRLSSRLEQVLRPTPEDLENPDFLALHTRLLLNTAARAAAILSVHDPRARSAASRIRDGIISLQVLPHGPAVHLKAENHVLTMHPGVAPDAKAWMEIKDMATAQRFLSGALDPFTAIATGDVAIRGQAPMLDALSIILDRVEYYLK